MTARKKPKKNQTRKTKRTSRKPVKKLIRKPVKAKTVKAKTTAKPLFKRKPASKPVKPVFQALEITRPKILNSKSKVLLADFFINSAHRSYFSGELSKRLPSRNLKNDLSFLARLGFLTPFAKKGLRYYRVNKKSPLHFELQTDIQAFKDLNHSKDLPISKDPLLNALEHLKGLRLAVLTGLFTANKRQDCDILLVGDLNKRAIQNFIENAQKLIGQELNYAVFSTSEFSLRSNTFDHFIKDIFDQDFVLGFGKL